MITIDFNSLGTGKDEVEQEDLAESCIEFLQNMLGPSEKVTISKEDENEPESFFSVYLNYSEYTLKDFSFYDELMDFATENELYVMVYDHNTKSSKGYLYDEDDDWTKQKKGNGDNYPK